MLRDAAWCCVVLRGAAWCCVVLRGAAWCYVLLRAAAWLGVVVPEVKFNSLSYSCCVHTTVVQLSNNE